MGNVDKLTDKQRECLRLVLRHYTSKEMARELGIGVDAVDQRLKSAMKKLGAATRLDAARMLAAYEGTDVPVLSNGRASAAPGRTSRLRAGLRRIGRLMPRSPRTRFLLWCCLFASLFGFIRGGVPLDDYLRDRQIHAVRRPASGTIVIVAIDERTERALGHPRRHLPALVDRLNRLCAASVVIGYALDRRMDPGEDRQLALALQRISGRLLYPVYDKTDPASGRKILVQPLPEFRVHGRPAHPFYVGRLWSARRVPLEVDVAGRRYPDLAVEMVGIEPGGRAPPLRRIFGDYYLKGFPLDYTIDPGSIPIVSAIDLIRDKVPPETIFAKKVLVGSTSSMPQTYAPAHGFLPDVYITAIAAETLIAGVPAEIPWQFPFVFALAAAILSAWARKAIVAIPLIGGASVALLVLPSILLPHRIHVDVSAALFLLLLVGSGLAWNRLRRVLRSRRDAAAQGA